MAIVNSVYKGKKLFPSEFICPHCFAARPYHLQPKTEDIALVPVAFLQTKDPSDVVVCRACNHAFDPQVLERKHQNMLKRALDQKTVGAGSYALYF